MIGRRLSQKYRPVGSSGSTVDISIVYYCNKNVHESLMETKNFIIDETCTILERPQPPTQALVRKFQIAITNQCYL